jgi:hypothetical protein
MASNNNGMERTVGRSAFGTCIIVKMNGRERVYLVERRRGGGAFYNGRPREAWGVETLQERANKASHARSLPNHTHL